MRKIFFLGCMIISIVVCGQEKTKLKNVEVSKGIHEQYYVLKSDSKVKHGTYVKFKPLLGGIYLEAGHFTYGLKTGEWTYFYNTTPWNSMKAKGNFQEDTKNGVWNYYYLSNTGGKLSNMSEEGLRVNQEDVKLLCTGIFQNDKKSGEWKYFDRNGNLLQVYNYSLNKLFYDSSFTSASDTINDKQGPVYIGSQLILQHDLNVNIRPTLIPHQEKYEKIKLRLNISDSGVLEDITTLSKEGSDDSFYSKIIEGIKSLPNDWIPKFENKIPVPSSYLVGVEYKISKIDDNQLQYVFNIIVDQKQLQNW